MTPGKVLIAILILAATVLAQGPATQLQPLSPVPVAPAVAANETPELWFVELSGPPTADGTSQAAVQAEKKAFRAAAKAAGISFTERFAFDSLWNGLSIRISPSQLSRLTSVPGVKNIYPVMPVALPPTTAQPSPELFTSLTMMGADVAQSELGLTGNGVRVAVMDSGIDYNHPDLGGCFGPGCRVAKGWDFVGDAYNADPTSPSYNPVPKPDPNPDDCAGHGTHVAGIIGANGVVKGVAPHVTFYAYRVFGCQGSTSDDIMIAAMERALADGAQVLNISIGSAFGWPQSPTGQASDRLVNKGVSVVASIGNSGASGLYSASAPGLGKKVIGVASFDNTRITLPAFALSPDGRLAGYNQAEAAPAAPKTGSLPMARTGTPASTTDACNVSPLPAGSLAGKAALIRRGGCSLYEKSLNAQNAGAAAVVLYNNEAGMFSPTVAGAPAITIPVVSVSGEDGLLIDGRIAGGPVTMTWTSKTVSAVNPTGGLISSFSSYGLAPDLTLKPDIGAPGGSVYSTYPLELGGYASLSGTSVASPHVAGSVALLLQARPHTPSQAVRTILQNSAVPKDWWGFPGAGYLDNVHRQGAGMLRIDSAVLSTTKIEPAKIELGESQPGPGSAMLTVTNGSAKTVTYDISHAPALSTGANTFAVSFFTGYATAIYPPSVTLGPGGSALVPVTITANPGLPDKSLYGGYIIFTPRGGGQVYRVPYAGFKGDYQSIQVLAPTPYGFPWLAKIIGDSLFNQPSGGTYTMQGDDVPYLIVHLDHECRTMRIEIFDAVSGKAWHRALNEDYEPRNSTATSFFAVGWDGTTVNGNKTNTVPNGKYVMKLSVLKALGDDNDWETWTSPVVTVARP